MTNPILLEVCIDSVESALAAAQGGAQRVELCSNLVEGGTTPSAGLIATVRDKIALGLYVMIRPRGGDFYYSGNEFATMERDVLTTKHLGADGVVFGILQQDGRVDITRTRALVDRARPLKVTFHRAFDMAAGFHQALDDVMEAGVDRVLTSGGEQNVEDGIATVAQLVHAANGRLAIMAGSGINETNVHRIVTETGVREIHASLRSTTESPMRYRNEKISMGAMKDREYQLTVVSVNKVQRLLQAAIG